MKIINYLLLLICLWITTLSFSQKSVKNWHVNDSLTWDDFQGRVKKDGSTAAISYVGLDSRYNFKNGIIYFSVVATFGRNQSWVLPDKKTNFALLKHEQVHFDLVEIYKRILIKRLISSSFKSNLKKVDKKYYSIYYSVKEELDNCQSLYDLETNHHKNKEKQDEWNEKVKILLQSLEEFAKDELIIDLNRNK